MLLGSLYVKSITMTDNQSIRFYNHSGLHTLHAKQLIPAGINDVWDFFSNPANLQKITPDHMAFKVTSPVLSEKMYPGQMISYRVSPVPGVRTSWLTEITQVREKEFFIDEQRIDPYKIWHHQHIFHPHENGVLMEDIVTYKAPLGCIGRLMEKLFIRKTLRKIFQYRIKRVEELFPKPV